MTDSQNTVRVSKTSDVIRVAQAICVAMGDDWDREGPDGDLIEAYGPAASAAIRAMNGPADATPSAETTDFDRVKPYLDGLRHARKLLAEVLSEVTPRSQQPYERGQRDALRELDNRLKRTCKVMTDDQNHTSHVS